ncbi:peptide ABC transporter permease [Marmoricola endophyticus]|uniref:Peptide ABC transporter permease n=1 Tax=Marmoricola endophyticus TaxID=2040280 RepID=A0A917F1P3_9ACTN|nr:ABC transporter permease [Marmoricola endophyticus]GGF36088.1 peptide ABC transporter permease [Marmoricola endophyticus]
MSLSESQLEVSPTPDEPKADDQPQSLEGLSPTKLAVRRFRKDRLSMIAFYVVAFVLVAAILAPIFTKIGIIDPISLNQDDKLIDPTLGGLPRGAAGGITWAHPLGIEPGTGRDVLSRLWYGVTFSLSISLAAAIVAIVVGTVLGIIAGFSGGLIDATVGRLIDLTLSFPQTLMLLALSSIFVAAIQQRTGLSTNPANAVYEIGVLGLFGWPAVARLIRGQVLSIREREFIEAAKLLGASPRRLYFKEILPNVWAPLLVSFTLITPQYVSAEAALSYLGVGIKPPTPTLGNILTDGVNYALTDFTYFLFPAIVIAVIVVSLNLFGDGVRDALDPKADR